MRGSVGGYRPNFGDMSGLRSPGPDYLSMLMNPAAGLGGHEALQRQLLYERERGLLAGSTLLPGSLASQHLHQRQQEEYFRWEHLYSILYSY